MIKIFRLYALHVFLVFLFSNDQKSSHYSQLAQKESTSKIHENSLRTHTHSAAAFHSDYYPQMCNFSWIHYSHTFPMWIQLIWNFLRSIEFRVIYGIEFMAFNLPCCCCCYCYCCSRLEQSSITQHVSIGVSIKYYNWILKLGSG